MSSYAGDPGYDAFMVCLCGSKGKDSTGNGTCPTSGLSQKRAQASPMNSLCSQCSGLPATAHCVCSALLVPYIQIPGTLETLGTTLRSQELDTDFSWNTTGNTGNAPVDSAQRRQRNSSCLNQAWWRADHAVQGKTSNTHVIKRYTVETLAPNVFRNYSQWG